jgi:hypothetical protein
MLRKTSHFLLLAVCVCLSTACYSTMSTQAKFVREGNVLIRQKCQLAGPVRGSSMLTGGLGDIGRHNAKAEAREQAAKMGATDIVWTRSSSFDWGFSAHVEGEAYRCGQKRTQAARR